MLKQYFCATLSALFCLLTGFSACHKTSKNGVIPHESTLSSQHVPTPLPLLPEEENPSLPDAPAPTHAPSDVWDISDVDTTKIDPARKLISFTFDDAPARYLENLVTVYTEFNEHNPDCVASATLFVNGYRFDKQTPTLLTAALAVGFELGNHTYSHADLTALSTEDVRAEIDRVDELLYPFDGKTRHLFRPPYGKILTEQKNTVNAPIMSWTIDTLDWTGVGEDMIFQTVMENKFSGAIVLMHDGYAETVQAVKRLLPALKADGYQVVTLSQMSKAHNCSIKNGREYIRLRKR